MGTRQVHSREGRQCGGRQKRANLEKWALQLCPSQENREVMGEREAGERGGVEVRRELMLGWRWRSRREDSRQEGVGAEQIW